MRIVPASVEIISPIDGNKILRDIELAARVCYKSEDRITTDSASKFVKRLLAYANPHLSVIEHVSVTVRFIVDRGVSHEIVRHRLASYSQESTRYCNYSKAKFGDEITVIDTNKFMDYRSFEVWKYAMESAEDSYLALLRLGNSPQMARSVLPNSLKTEIVMTCNAREWRHFFAMRTPKEAHPQMREVARPLLREFRDRIPVLFDDVGTLGESDND